MIFRRLFGGGKSKLPEPPKPEFHDIPFSFRFGTGTATICVFDPQRLKHRLEDTCDWWSVPEDEVEELNKGNLIIVGLLSDGGYGVDVVKSHSESPAVIADLFCDSGHVYIGYGEGISGQDTEPYTDRYPQGRFINLEPGIYRVSFYFEEPDKITTTFEKAESLSNDFAEPLLIGTDY